MLSCLKRFAQKFKPSQHSIAFPDTIHIETSYACNLKCMMCPRHFEGEPQGMLSLHTFKERILPALPRFRYTHLTGWGEPLINRDFAEMLRLAKEAGIWSCVTTNGILLRSPLDRKLLEYGINLINVSIDASTPETYNKVRGKEVFDLVIERVRDFNALRKTFPNPPTTQWTFVMMKSNLSELPEAVRMAGELGFDRFVAKHLESFTTAAGLEEALFNTGIAPDLTPEENALLETALQQARRQAEASGVDLEIHPRRCDYEGMCLSRPNRTIFVDWQGYVSPCCYLNRLDVRPYAQLPEETGVLGQLSEQTSLIDLIESPAYQKFREDWEEKKVPLACQGCLQVTRMTTHP